MIEKYPDKDWHFGANPSCTLEMIEKYPDKEWDWNISCNPNITIDFLKTFQHKLWNFFNDGVSENLNITIDFIKQFPYENWNWEDISYNTNITIKFIDEYSDKIDFQRLSCNKFEYHNYKFKKIKLFYYLSVIYDIKRYIMQKF
jgi:hypothetical protein